MRYNRQALLRGIEVALKADRDYHEQQVAKTRKSYEEKKSEWVAQHSDEWRESVKKINKALRTGKPITVDMLPLESPWRNSVGVFTTGEPTPRDYVAPRDLLRLQGILSVIEDDVVTTTGLRDLGLTGNGLRDALHYLRAVDSGTNG